MKEGSVPFQVLESVEKDCVVVNHRHTPQTVDITLLSLCQQKLIPILTKRKLGQRLVPNLNVVTLQDPRQEHACFQLCKVSSQTRVTSKVERSVLDRHDVVVHTGLIILWIVQWMTLWQPPLYVKLGGMSL
jgi:hypothetical protein